ncbi:MAG: methyltransferase domain-containing protein [Methylococcaceae bacterium]|nr:methyltransferase domain-containing protein [Methylococcaceae bacterium]
MIQNVISLLPATASNAFYFWMQRHFGGLRKINPAARLVGGIGLWKLIKQSGYDPKGKVFLEIGTGRVPMLPLAFWLMGGTKIITVDLHPYLKAELTKDCLQYIVDNTDEILNIFGDLIDESRLDDLIHFNSNTDFSINAFFDLCCIEYLAPADATKLPLAAKSIDFYSSYNVFEHIPPTVLQQIFTESNRVIKDDGLFVHRIDYSDHFAHDDKSISAINFLQYTDAEWGKYAGNSYMYMNRMRHDDFLKLFQSAGQSLLVENPVLNQDCLTLLNNQRLPLDMQFKEKSIAVLAISGAWIASKKCS